MNNSPENFAEFAEQSASDWAMQLSDDEADYIRSGLLKGEAALKQYGLSLTGIYVLLAAASLMAVLGPNFPGQAFIVLSMAILFTLAALISIVTNYGVRRSASWSRRPLILLCYAVLPIPVFGAFGWSTLRLLRANQRPSLLSREHAFVVRRTSKMNERTSFLTWVAVVLICILILSLIVIGRMPPEVRHMR